MLYKILKFSPKKLGILKNSSYIHGMEKNSKSASFGLGTILFLIFLTLKLAGIGEVATWSWWWVTSPLWIPLVLIVGVVIIVGLATYITDKY